MSITTFTTLRAAVENWFSRPGDTNLQDRSAEFIANATARINRIVRTLEMETRADITLTAGEEYILQPSNFAGLRGRPRITSTNPNTVLHFMAPSHLDQIVASTTEGTPSVIAIVGNEFRIRPIPDSAYTLEIRYYLKVPELSGTNETNWLLTAHPDLYLYATMLQATAYIGNDERIPIWKAGFDEALAELELMDKRDRWSGAPLQQRSDVLTA